MGSSIPNAAAFLAAAHHRSLHRRKRAGKSAVKATGSVALRIAVAAIVLVGLIVAIAAMMGVLS